MAVKVEQYEAAKSAAIEFLPQGEDFYGFIMGQQEVPTSASFGGLAGGLIAGATGDNARNFGIIFSDKTAVFIAYEKKGLALNLNIQRSFALPLRSLLLKKKLAGHKLKFINDQGKKASMLFFKIKDDADKQDKENFFALVEIK